MRRSRRRLERSSAQPTSDRTDYSIGGAAAVARGARARRLICFGRCWEHILLAVGVHSFRLAPRRADGPSNAIGERSFADLLEIGGDRGARAPTLGARAHQFLTFASSPNLQAQSRSGSDGDAWLSPMRMRSRRRAPNGGGAERRPLLCCRARRPLPVRRLAASGSCRRRTFAAPLSPAGVAFVPLSPSRTAEAHLCSSLLLQTGLDDRCVLAIARSRALSFNRERGHAPALRLPRNERGGLERRARNTLPTSQRASEPSYLASSRRLRR